MRPLFHLLLGAAFGVAGGYLFSESQPPDHDSLEAQLEEARREAAKYKGYHNALVSNSLRSPDTTSARVKQILRDIKEGREVSPDQVFATMKPWMRNMQPIFQRMRQVNAEDWADSIIGDWGHRYQLSDTEEQKLREWLKGYQLRRQVEMDQIIDREDGGFVELMQTMNYDWRDSAETEEQMESILSGERLAAFRAERLEERATSVELEARRNLTRLDDIVALDDEQHFALFGLMARGSEDYRPKLEFDGMESDKSPLDLRSRNEAIRETLRPDQLELLDEHRAHQQEEAEKQMKRLGLTLPRNWDLLDGDQF